MLVLGEIRTCMLQNSKPLGRPVVADLLRLVPGERVRLSERPVAHAVSPTTTTGVDCQLRTASCSRCRGVGTVAARAVVTGGRILQGSAYVRLMPGTADHRLAWSHYLAMLGVVETIGKFNLPDLTEGFLAGHEPGNTLDLGAVSERIVGTVQRAPQLDHVIALRSRRTRMRWAAVVADADARSDSDRPGGELVIVDDVVRTFRLSVSASDLDNVVGFCENLALHDWILTTLLNIVERAEIDWTSNAAAETKLRPVVSNLLHLWMPGAHVDEALMPLWHSLERRPGFTRQWEATVTRIRDQLALSTIAALNRR